MTAASKQHDRIAVSLGASHRKKKITLKGLLSAATKENVHGEISTGKRVGKEI